VPESIWFVSDAHFGWSAAEAERRRSFRRFLESARGLPRLVIAGDLFHFWFDLGSTFPKGYFDILEALHGLSLSGTHIDYLAGNHDFWRSGFFRDELGVETHAGPLEIATQGRRILVAHGDGQGPGDHGYKLLKRIVRSRGLIGLARLVHPDLLRRFALGLGAVSHAHTSNQRPDMPRLEAAAGEAFARGFDAFVMGHVHAQVHRRLAGGELLVIGDWLELCSYVKLEGGVFTPCRWAE
jgi:UDP-2,3-diacylglucosamine hydrolase